MDGPRNPHSKRISQTVKGKHHMLSPICAILKKKKKRIQMGLSVLAQWVMKPAGIHEDPGSIPGLIQWVKDLALL